MALILFIATSWICVQKDLGIFIIIAANGSYAVIVMIIFFLLIGIYSLTNTKYSTSLTPPDRSRDEFVKDKIVPLFNTEIDSLGGVLATGYHIHSMAI